MQRNIDSGQDVIDLIGFADDLDPVHHDDRVPGLRQGIDGPVLSSGGFIVNADVAYLHDSVGVTVTYAEGRDRLGQLFGLELQCHKLLGVLDGRKRLKASPVLDK